MDWGIQGETSMGKEPLLRWVKKKYGWKMEIKVHAYYIRKSRGGPGKKNMNTKSGISKGGAAVSGGRQRACKGVRGEISAPGGGRGSRE